MYKYFSTACIVFCLIFLSACSTTQTIKKESAKKLLLKSTQALEKKYDVKNSGVILTYDLANSSSKHLTNNNYASLINDAKYNKNFLASIKRFDKNIIERKAKEKLSQLKLITSCLAKNKIHFKHKISIKGSNNFNELVKVHNKLARFLPILLPSSHPSITSHYGVRVHPITKKKKFHSGIDLTSSKRLIFSAADGIVTQVDSSNGYGKSIAIDHLNGFKTLYAHLDKVLVSKNQRVIQGEMIGLEGKTGVATGVHLHFETIYKNKKINPFMFLQSQF
jgi:murein DD-endopeptidase MepM/ murein hydrolase activator NlpD